MRLVSVLFVILLSFPLWAVAEKAQVQPMPPHERIQDSTDKLLILIDEAKVYFAKEPERFYAGVEGLIDPLVDFRSFTRSVMGPYGTKKYYKSLKTKAERDAYKANFKRFVETFQNGLINTYAKGLLAFNGQKIEIVPATDEDLENIKAKKAVDVVQKIHGEDKIYKVIYKMRPNKKGEWLLRNVTIESINVGLLYRNQFVAAMDKYKADFGKVIDNWVVDAKDFE